MYQSRLTWESLLLFEMQSIAELLLLGKTWNEIRKAVLEENLFQYEKVSSAKKRFWLIKRRFSYLPDEWTELLLKDSTNAKILTLYSISRDSLLFLDFLRITLSQKILKKNLVIYKDDVEAYLQLLSDQWTDVEWWTSKTKKKVEQVIMKILKDADIVLDDRISIPYISTEIKSYLIDKELWSVFISYLWS